MTSFITMQLQSLTPYFYLSPKVQSDSLYSEYIAPDFHTKNTDFCKFSNKHQKLTFQGRKEQPSSLKAWFEKVTLWLTTKQSLRLKIRYLERITGRTLIPTGLDFNIKYIERNNRLSKAHFSIPGMSKMTFIGASTELDKNLEPYLESEAVQKLKKMMPGKQSSVNEELMFLDKLINLTSQQFMKHGLSVSTQIKIHELDYLPIYREKRQQHIHGTLDTHYQNDPNFLEYLTHHTHLPYRPLTSSMDRGVGICNHEALLNKVTVDYLTKDKPYPPDLSISYIIGCKKEKEDEPFSSQNQHCWNKVKFPSGRKYLLDSAQLFRTCLPGKDGKSAQKPVPELGLYMSFNRMLKLNTKLTIDPDEGILYFYPEAK